MKNIKNRRGNEILICRLGMTMEEKLKEEMEFSKKIDDKVFIEIKEVKNTDSKIE